MKTLEKYIKYFKNNPKDYWFKRKLYGWGWTPATWQGWSITLLYIILIIVFSLTIDKTSQNNEIVSNFFIPIILLTVAFICIAYKKGEKPRWQWGPKD